MHPILFQWKFLTVHTYGVFAALGFVFGGSLCTRWAKRWGVSPKIVSDGLFPMLLGGVVGARIAYAALHPGEFSGFIEFLQIWRGGLMWQGGFVGGVLAGIWYFRRKKVSLALAADVMAPGVALA